MERCFNFSAGPATMPPEVLQQAAEEMLNWPNAQGQFCGMSVMEMSHRGKAFLSIYEQTLQDFRTVLNIPAQFKILFMQGGGLAQNALVPLNLCGGSQYAAPQADFVITGSWSCKSQQEAQKYCTAHIAASGRAQQFREIPNPASWQLHDDSSYVHLCSNETIDGVEFHTLPDLHALGSKAPLVIDFSSHMASRPVDWSRVGLAFGGAQKNLGPAGLTLVVIREDLLDRALPICPSVFDYKTVAKNDSMLNTPPTYSIYMAGLVLQWIRRQGGIKTIEQNNIAKAHMLYDAIDKTGFYQNHVSTNCRSRMNVPFYLHDERLNEAFLAGAQAAGLVQLKGHKSVGGMRASLYNAMPVAGVIALVQYMQEFERCHG
jgi:phosphoserine aminotransferase